MAFILLPSLETPHSNKDYVRWGGGADKDDLELAKTASREVLEESIGFYAITPLDLYRSFSHTAETDKGVFYRMYFSEVEFIDTRVLNDALKQAKGCSKEYTSFYWVSLSDLVNYDGSSIKVENKNFSLFPPFHKMLQEKNVQNLLKHVIDKGKLPGFPFVVKNGRKPLHSSDRPMDPMSHEERERTLDTKLSEAIVIKAQTNLLIKQYGSIHENGRATRAFEFLKDDLSLREAFLENIRGQACPQNQQQPLDPVEASLSLTIAKKELGGEWEPIDTTDPLDEAALRRNIRKFLTKNQIWEWGGRERPILYPQNISDELLDVLVVHIKREIANPDCLPLYHGTQKSIENSFYTLARLRETLYMDPTSSYAGLRATDAYFFPNFPRTTEKLIPWLKSGNRLSTDSQNFCASLGIWGCKFGLSLSLFTKEIFYSHQDLPSILQTGFAFLGVSSGPDLLMAPMKEQDSSSVAGLVQILVPPKVSLGYPSDSGLNGKPISINKDNFSPHATAQGIRLGGTSFRDSHEIRFSPGSWNTHNPQVGFYGARGPTPEQNRQISNALTQIAVDWIRSRKIFPKGALAHQDSFLAQNPENDYGPDNLPPFFRLVQQVLAGVQGDDYKMSVSEDLLPLFLKSKNIEGALQYLKIFPEAAANISSYKGVVEGIIELVALHHNNSEFWGDHSSEIKTCLVSHAKKYLRNFLYEKFKSSFALKVQSTYLPALENLLSYPEFKEIFHGFQCLELLDVDPTQLPPNFWEFLSEIKRVEAKLPSREVLNFSSCPISEVWVENEGSILKEVILSPCTTELKILYGSLPKIRAMGLKELFLYDPFMSALDLSDLSGLKKIKFCDHRVRTAKLPASVEKIEVYGECEFPKLTGDVTHLKFFHSFYMTNKILDLSELHSLKEIFVEGGITFESILIDPQVVIEPDYLNAVRKTPVPLSCGPWKWLLEKLGRL